MPTLTEFLPYVTIPFIGAIPGSIVVRNNLDWYTTLRRPSFTPPQWMFGPVWTYLYATIGFASYLVYRDASPGEAFWPLLVYFINLLVNWSWTPIFFGGRKIGHSVIIILLTLATAVYCNKLFFHVSTLAGLLMIPYVGWLGLATTINIGVWILNSTANVQSTPRRLVD